MYNGLQVCQLHRNTQFVINEQHFAKTSVARKNEAALAPTHHCYAFAKQTEVRLFRIRSQQIPFGVLSQRRPTPAVAGIDFRCPRNHTYPYWLATAVRYEATNTENKIQQTCKDSGSPMLRLAIVAHGEVTLGSLSQNKAEAYSRTNAFSGTCHKMHGTVLRRCELVEL